MNRTESPEIDSHKCSQLTFGKQADNRIQWSRDTLQQMVLENWITTCK